MSSHDNRKPSPTDRRGINRNGQLPKQRHKLSSLKNPCGLLLLVVVTLAQTTGLLSTREKHTAIDRPLRSSSFGSKKRDEVDLNIRDGRVGSFKGEVAWPLKDAEMDSWARLERTIDAIIARTPAKEYEFTPSVFVEAYCLGVSRDKAKPTVLIGSTSKKRAAQLEKTLKRSGVLKTATVPFQVVIRDPEDKTDAWLSNMTTDPVHSTFISGAAAV